MDQWGYNPISGVIGMLYVLLITAMAGPPGGDERKPQLTLFQLVLRVVVVLGLVVVIEVQEELPKFY